VAGEAVAAGGLEAGVAGEFGDEDDVVAGADEPGQAGVSQGVCGGFEVGVLGEPADGEVDRSGGESLAFEREQQGGLALPGRLVRWPSQASRASRASVLSGTCR